MEGRWKALLGETHPFGEEELTTDIPSVTTQTPNNPAMCNGHFCFISNTGKFVELSDLYTKRTSLQDMNTSISIGVLCILALVCIIVMTVFLSKCWHHQCYRNNRIAPDDVEMGQVPNEQNTYAKKRELPTVCAHVKKIEVMEATLSKVVETMPVMGKHEITETSKTSVKKISSDQEIVMSCPGFLTDATTSTDTLIDKDRNLIVREHR